jgi:uncharacterized protein YuzE
MNHLELKIGNQTEPPIVEIDTEASSTYVRFSNKAVVNTLEIETEKLGATADLDDQGEIVGLKVTGLEDFTIDTLLATKGIDGIFSKVPKTLLNRTRYISARNLDQSVEDAYDLQMIKDRADDETISGEEVFKQLGL